MGRPPDEKPHGTLAAGFPAMLKGRVKGVNPILGLTSLPSMTVGASPQGKAGVAREGVSSRSYRVKNSSTEARKRCRSAIASTRATPVMLFPRSMACCVAGINRSPFRSSSSP